MNLVQLQVLVHECTYCRTYPTLLHQLFINSFFLFKFFLYISKKGVSSTHTINKTTTTNTATARNLKETINRDSQQRNSSIAMSSTHQEAAVASSGPQPQGYQPWYTKGSLPLGSCIFGIPMYLHWTYFALLGIMLLFTLIRSEDAKYWAVIALIYGPIMLVTIIIVSTFELGGP